MAFTMDQAWSLGLQIVAACCLAWCSTVVLIQGIGVGAIFRHFSSRPQPPVSATLPRDQVPHVTIIRPVAGLETELLACLRSTFLQEYPRDRISIRLCVEDSNDAAYPLLRRLVDEEFPEMDAQVLLESGDPNLHGAGGNVNNLGPNRKIRNISRAYREATGDILWMVDSNCWLGKHTLGRMVDKLVGLSPDGPTTPYKFVHQVPLVVDTSRYGGGQAPSGGERERFLSRSAASDAPGDGASPSSSPSTLGDLWRMGGGRLDEMFMATTHAKFYVAFSAIGAACFMGKSNMFRKSDLDASTDAARNPRLPASARLQPVGIDHFSSYISEDHVIGDRLWDYEKPGHGKHALLFGDLAIQPLCDFSVSAYVARRIRWLRARKWTVLVATWVEPGIESLLWALYLSFALTTLPWFRAAGIPPTWGGMAAVWSAGVVLWCIVDWFTFRRLHSGCSVYADEDTPAFPSGELRRGRGLGEWLSTWMAREVLALPVWAWAFYRPTIVQWRGKTFKVASDMTVVECTPKDRPRQKRHER